MGFTLHARFSAPAVGYHWAQSPYRPSEGDSDESTQRSARHPHGCVHALGEVAEPARLTVADLRTGWEQHRIEVVFDCATAGPQPAPGTSAP